MTHGRLSRFARAQLGALVICALLASCSGSNNRPETLGADPIQTAINAMKAAGSGKINGTITGAKGATGGSVEGSWQGDLTGKFTAHAVFVDGTAKLPVDARLLNGKFYFSRTIGTGPDSDPYSIFLHPKGFKPWKVASVGGIFNGVTSFFSPLAALQWIKNRGTGFTAESGQKVGSVKATKLTSKTRVLLGPFLSSQVSLWVDGKGRLLRLSVSSPEGSAQYDVTDLGAPVTVTPPPAGDISTVSELPKIEPAGPFATVKSGTAPGVIWALQRAPGTQGTVCWRWQGTPPLPQTQLASPSTPRCLTPPPAHPEDPSDSVQFVVIGNGSASYDALAVLLPAGVKHVTFGLVGGKLDSLPVASPLVWVGPPSPTKAYLGVTLADGTVLQCGAGAISAPSDLTDPSLTGPVATAAWGCLPPS